MSCMMILMLSRTLHYHDGNPCHMEMAKSRIVRLVRLARVKNERQHAWVCKAGRSELELEARSRKVQNYLHRSTGRTGAVDRCREILKTSTLSVHSIRLVKSYSVALGSTVGIIFTVMRSCQFRYKKKKEKLIQEDFLPIELRLFS